VTVFGIDPRGGRATTNGDSLAGPLEAGNAIVGASLATSLGISNGQPIRFSGPLGERTLTVQVSEAQTADCLSALMPEDERAALAGRGAPRLARVSPAADADPAAVTDAIAQLASVTSDASGNSVEVQSTATVRAQYTRFIDSLLIVVTAPLGDCRTKPKSGISAKHHRRSERCGYPRNGFVRQSPRGVGGYRPSWSGKHAVAVGDRAAARIGPPTSIVTDASLDARNAHH
jgi:hypothetical protein